MLVDDVCERVRVQSEEQRPEDGPLRDTVLQEARRRGGVTHPYTLVAPVQVRSKPLQRSVTDGETMVEVVQKHLMVDGVERCRQIEQHKNCTAVTVDSVQDVVMHTEKSSLRAVILFVC